MITDEQRKQAFKNAPERIVEMSGSLDTAKLLSGLRKKYSIQNDSFIDIVGDVLTGLLPRNLFESSLESECKLTTENAKLIAGELKPFFDKASGAVTVPDANADLKEKLELRPTAPTPATRPPLAAPPQYGAPTTPRPTGGAQVPSGSTPQTVAPGGARPLTREELMSALGGKRTMAQDIEALRAKKDAAKDDA